MKTGKNRLLLLAGTRDARVLAEKLAGVDGLEVIASLAGVTSKPKSYAVPVRRGGFGGAEGLAEFLRLEQITCIVDATHPFAREISANAVKAADLTQVPLLRVRRPAWQKKPGDDWRCFDQLEKAVAALPQAARVFAAIGRKELQLLQTRPDLWLLTRMVEAPTQGSMPFAGETVLGYPRCSVQQEAELLKAYGIQCLLAKNSGGSAAYAKIEAARNGGLPVYLVNQPTLPPVKEAASTSEAFNWVMRVCF
ncbi:cobalt-precorrin-6A reductase [Pseudovibrio sp. SPO723]|uniref:cobalt-precorrin-6A reductase n=1 Tax=Nesiotobacter zosterae TaxID=392721 RepID=UPI0029C2AFA3|nr:cobalt-precorrin-6A reductase [Pseudovibrio sp. SPO723]MDX5592234.1 cobalt-precorrin-6A reductase [Pseudovibrio sp. SPO723]